MLTRKAIEQMDERELRERVLVPLFRVLGFRDVKLFHGGPLEQGKDIVMWKAGDFVERQNYGVVVKAVDITGQATGRGSAAEVLFQVKQCHGASYPDPVTSASEHVSICLVVNSHRITKEALTSLQSTLTEANLWKTTQLIDGDRLWDLIQKHLPEAALAKLQEVNEILDDASPHHRLTFKGDRGGITIGVESKHPDADRLEPLDVRARFRVPDTPAGRELQRAIEQHIKTGSPLRVTSEFLESIELPDLLRPHFQEGVSEIAFGPRENPVPIVARLLMNPSDGESAALDNLILRGVQVGSDQATFTNRGQSLPWEIELTFRRDGPGTVAFTFKYEGVNVKRQLETVRFQTALSKGGTLRIENLETGLALATLPVAPGAFPTPNPGYLRLLVDLLVVQERTKVLLDLPPRDIDSDELDEIARVVAIIKTGQISLPLGEASVTGDRVMASELLAAIDKGEEVVMTAEGTEVAKILGREISLGSYSSVLRGLTLSVAAREALRDQLAISPHEGEEFRITFERLATAQTSVYPQWQPAPQALSGTDSPSPAGDAS